MTFTGETRPPGSTRSSVDAVFSSSVFASDCSSKYLRRCSMSRVCDTRTITCDLPLNSTDSN